MPELLQRNHLNQFKYRQRNLIYPAPVLKTHQNGFWTSGYLVRQEAPESTAMLAAHANRAINEYCRRLAYAIPAWNLGVHGAVPKLCIF